METFSVYLLSLSSALITYFLQKNSILRIFKRRNIVAVNYRGRLTINGAGILLLLPSIASTIVMFLFYNSSIYILFILAILALSLSGFIDDVLGTSSAKGLLGHLRCFFNGEFSTGIIKAITGIVVGTMIALFIYSNFPELIIDILLFSLSVNFINLLDLRPGRAVKVFIIFTILLLLLSGFEKSWIILPVYLLLFFYLNGEMNEVYMMGDTGACLLGSGVGFYSVLTLSLRSKALLVFLLVCFHMFTEYYSLSEIVERVPTLKRLDRLGRKD